ESVVNADLGLPEVFTVSVGGATNDTKYILTLTDEGGNVLTTVEYLSDGSATTGEIADGLYAAWRANPIAGAYCRISQSTTTLTVTGTLPGRALGLASNHANVVVSNVQDAAPPSGIG